MITTACAPTLRESLNHRTLQAPISRQSRVHVDVKASEIRWEEPISINFEPKKLRRSLAFAIQEVLNGPNRQKTNWCTDRLLLHIPTQPR